jgi:two-component system sensor histidine kinase BaeS
MPMADGWHLGILGRRIAAAFLLVSLVSLTVLFIGTVVPHLPDQHLDPHDPVSLLWLLVATAIAVLTAVVLSVVIARRLVSPIEGYITAARRFAAGDHSARPDAQDGPPEFDELVAAMIAAADEIERSEMTRRQLTADIAHELRTPLAALQAGLEELRDGYVAADAETLAALHAQATRLGRIVNDLADLSAAESAGIHLDSRNVDLAELARDALTMSEGRLGGAGLRTEADITAGVIVHADPDRVLQVLDNLLVNATLYCRPGDRVAVRVRRDGDVGVVEVADSGPGFRAEEMPVLFDRAWRGHSAGGTSGSGLGLPIVRALVTAQGGSVTVDSVEGAGATFTIRLPLASR